MTPADFEARYRRDIDPWGYASSPYEQAKYAATLAACGTGPHGCALELGSSIGILSAQLAPRCERLVTIDAAPTAVRAARARLAGLPQVEVRLGVIPDDLPDETHDLIVASEILYYLSPSQLTATLGRLERQSRPGARWVVVHWRPPGSERPLSAAEVHEQLRSLPWLRPIGEGSTEDYLLDILERR